MSALRAPSEDWSEAAPPSPRPPLRSVPSAPERLARVPFLLVLIGLIGIGMTGLLMLNTTLQNQAFEARVLSRSATELAHRQAALESQLDSGATPEELARRASALGLRPDPHPAFLVLPGGKILGTPRPVTGGEMPHLVVKTPAEVAAERAAEKAERRAAAAKKAAAKKAAEKKAAEEKAAAKKEAAKKKATAKAAKKPQPTDPAGQGDEE